MKHGSLLADETVPLQGTEDPGEGLGGGGDHVGQLGPFQRQIQLELPAGPGHVVRQPEDEARRPLADVLVAQDRQLLLALEELGLTEVLQATSDALDPPQSAVLNRQERGRAHLSNLREMLS